MKRDCETNLQCEHEIFRDYSDQDPYSFYEELRRRGPVIWDESMGGYLVTGYDDAAYIQKREDLFQHPYADLAGAVEVKGARSVLLLHGEEHKVMHRFLTRYLSSPQSLRRFRDDFIKPLAHRRIDTFVKDGTTEFATSFGEQLPVDVIAALIGLPWQDEELLGRCKALNDKFIRWSESFGDDPAVLDDALAAGAEMDEILTPFVRERAKNPSDDLISVLWSEGPKLLPNWSERDVLDQCKTLFPAGGETTAYLIDNMMFLLLHHEQLMSTTAKSPADVLPKLVEEALRLHGSIHFRIREVVQATTLRGVYLNPGDRMFPITAAADRDENQFPNAEELDLDRKEPWRHIAFNVGPRQCVGAAFARAEAIAAYECVFERLSNIRSDPTAPPPGLRGFLSRGFRPINILFDDAGKR
jgi:cytochrome P450